MAMLIITMCIRPEKHQELLVTLNELESLKQQASGYVESRIHNNPEDEQIITLCEQWQTRKDLERYMQSYAFEVLCGALRVLTLSAELDLFSGGWNQVHQESSLHVNMLESISIRRNIV